MRAVLVSSKSIWAQTARRFIANRAATTAVFFLSVLIILCLLAPILTPYSYEQQNLELGASAPSWTHLFGTDANGRDLFTRVLYGGRVSLFVGVCATVVSLLIGVTYGAVSGYAGGRADAIMMRVVDTLYAQPFIVLVIVLMVVFGRNIYLMFAAIGAIEWLTMARIVRGQVLSLKDQPFVKAATVLGYSRSRILFRHIVPNIMGHVVVYATLTIPQVILLESFLSFLGLGVQAPMSSWGLLIGDGAAAMETYPWLIIAPGLLLSGTLFALNFIGDGLRDALDPRFMPGSGGVLQ